MVLFLLLVVAFIIMIGITALFLLATKKAYNFEHKIDPHPTNKKDSGDLK